MSGTKMTLKRYAPITLDFKTHEVIVDQEFIENNGLNIPIPYSFTPNKGQLDVFFRGEFLHSGGGYEELNDNSIRLDLGVDENGNPYTLEEGDEIFIKVWDNQYCSRGEEGISKQDFLDLQREVWEAREYKEGIKFNSLDERLDYIQKTIELVDSGLVNVDIEYEHNSKGQIVKQVISGDVELTRLFTFNEINEIEEEKIVLEDGTTVIKTNMYDMASRRLLQTRVRVNE